MLSRPRTLILAPVLVLAALSLAGWAYFESRQQQRESVEALRQQAGLIAGSLGPGIAAATRAVHELEELLGYKVLDTARYLAHIERLAPFTDAEMDRFMLESGIDSIVLVDARGNVVRRFGEPVPREDIAQTQPIAAGGVEEGVFGWTVEQTHGHLSAATRRAGGGAVLVRIDVTQSYAFARGLGLQNLVQALVGEHGVLYLVYTETPGDTQTWATWDGQDPPPGAGASDTVREIRDRRIYEVAVPVVAPAGRSGTLRVGLDAAPLRRATSMAERRTLLVGFFLALVGLLGAAFAAVSRLRELEAQEGARQLAKAEEARRQGERLAMAGALSAGLAHEVRSPLNAIGLAAQRIERRMPEGSEDRGFASQIRREVRRLDETLKGFLDLARPGTGQMERTDLGALVREVVGLLEVEALDKGVRLEVADAAATARIDRDAVRRALVNLVRNALQATPAGRRVSVAVETTTEVARLRVVDEGTGLPPAIAESVFDAFVTGRAEGTGLGLSLVRRVAEEHGGRASIRNRDHGGAEAVLELPLDGRRRQSA